MELDLQNKICLPETAEPVSEFPDSNLRRYRLPRANKIQSKKLCVKQQKNASLKKVAVILQKCPTKRSDEENKVLDDCSEEVKEVRCRWKRRDDAKKRLEEFEDPPDILKKKCEKLAQAIAQAQHLVIYTGAGISTSAKIPDYRGSNGIWTRLQQGRDIGNHDLTLAEPTYTHMALFELYRRNILKYVVSQNCDGLHLRSGLPKTVLSELHGNMYLEVCTNCKPNREYLRAFDVTENTSRYFHKTSRKCYLCNSPLVDTIVHFGERGTLQWPLNWKGACLNAKKATTILCLGSSLKVLKKYPWLWQMDKPAKRRANLYIVNLQWTPKDDYANVKIHGKCDEIMKNVMECLDISTPCYDKMRDPLYFHHSKLSELEMHTTTQPFLKDSMEELVKDEKINSEVENSDMNYLKNNRNSLFDKSSVINQLKTCDNDVNINSMELRTEDSQNSKNNSPQKSSSSFQSVFSIDSILENTTTPVVNTFSFGTHDFQKNLRVNNLVFNEFMDFSKYKTYFRNELIEKMSQYYYYSYPYQSSWLYSGLHNIINPVSVRADIEIGKEIVKLKNPSCKFCYNVLNSLDCLFYLSIESVFVKQEFRYSKIQCKEKPNVCVCCDYTTDEDETNNKHDENKEQNLNDKNKITAGWFGKGYKKGSRHRRK